MNTFNPQTINQLQNNGYLLDIQRVPNLSYFCTRADIPAVRLNLSQMRTPFREIPFPSDTLDFDTLAIEFKIDESMNNYFQLFEWLMAMGFPRDREQHSNFIDKVRESPANNIIGNDEFQAFYSPATLQILGANNTPIATLEFVDLFPSDLSSFTRTSQDNSVDYVSAICHFEYTYYNLKPVKT